MRVVIKKFGTSFEVDPVDLPGSPGVGRGPTMDAALGSFLRQYQQQLGVEIEVDSSAQQTEKARRYRELRKR